MSNYSEARKRKLALVCVFMFVVLFSSLAFAQITPVSAFTAETVKVQGASNYTYGSSTTNTYSATWYSDDVYHISTAASYVTSGSATKTALGVTYTYGSSLSGSYSDTSSLNSVFHNSLSYQYVPNLVNIYATGAPTYVYGTSTSGSYLDTLISDNTYHLSTSSSYVVPTTVNKTTTGAPTYTSGSSTSGAYTDTQTSNDIYHVSATDGSGGSGSEDDLATGAPTYTYGTSTSGSYTDTQTSNDVYHVSTTASYTGPDAGTLKAPTVMSSNNSIGTVAWTTPDNAKISDNVWTTSSSDANAYTYYLKGITFGFAVSGTVNGIEVRIEKHRSVAAGASCSDYHVYLLQASVIGGDDKKTAGSWALTTDAVVTYGSSTDLWGRSWTAAQINAANFGVVISASITSSGNVETAYVDYISITVYMQLTYYRIDYYYAFQFTTVARASVTQLDWYAEGKTSGDTVTIYLWNWVGSTWDSTGKTWTTTEATQSQTSVTINNYMDASGNMRIRLSVTGLSASRTISADYLRWHVAYNTANYYIDYYYSFQFTEGARADVTTLIWYAEGKISADSITVYLYNWGTTSWDSTSKTWTSSEATKSGTVSAATYMDASGNMRIRLYVTGLTASRTISVDYLDWSVTYNINYYRIDYNYPFQFTQDSRLVISSLIMSAEGKTSAGTAQIYLYNYTSSAWVDTTKSWTSSETTQTKDILSSITSFMDASGNMKIRLYLTGAVSSFTVSVDCLFFAVSYGATYSSGHHATSESDDASQGGTLVWNNLNYVEASDDAYAYIGVSLGTTSHYLKTGGYGFTIADGYIIDGIQVSIERHTELSTTNDLHIKLIKAGSYVGNDESAGAAWNNGSDTNGQYGSATDLWGTTWTPLDIRNSGFGVGLAITKAMVAASYVDYIVIVVYYHVMKVNQIDYYYNFQFTDATRASVTSLVYTVNGLTSNATVGIYLYNYTSSSWVSTGNSMTSGQTTQSADVTVNLLSYMDPSGNLLIRLYVALQVTPFITYMDYLSWSISYSQTKYRIQYYYTFQITNESRGDIVNLEWYAEGKTSNPTIGIYLYDWGSSTFVDTTKTWTTSEGTQNAVIDAMTYLDTSGYLRIEFSITAITVSFTVSVDYLALLVSTTIGVPTLMYPANNTVVSTAKPTLQWNRATSGINPLNYHLQVSTVVTFVSTVLNITTINTWYSFAANLTVGLFYWHVRTIDRMNNIGNWSKLGIFTVDNIAPSKVVLFSPLPSHSVERGNNTLVWGASSDADSGVRYYQAQVSTLIGFSTLELNITTINDHGIFDAVSLIRYYWRVRAVDNLDNIGAWSDIWSFFVGKPLTIIWDANPHSFYQTGPDQDYRFHVIYPNNTVLLASTYTVSVSLDGSNDIASWVSGGVYWNRTIHPLSYSPYMHTIIVTVNKTDFNDGSESTDFTIYQYYLRIVNWNGASSIAQPNSQDYTFQIQDSGGAYHGISTIVAYRDAYIAVSFTYAAGVYKATMYSSGLSVGTHTLVVVVSEANYQSDSTNRSFDVLQSQLTIEWVAPTWSGSVYAYKPSSIMFSFRVHDSFGIYYSSIDMTKNRIDGTTMTFAWNVTANAYTCKLYSTSYAEGYHIIFLNITKNYYASDTDFRTFEIKVYHLSISGWTGSANNYYPDAYVANWTLTNEAGILQADSMTATLDGWAPILYPMTITYYGSGLYGLSLPTQDIFGSNLWGVGNHTIMLTATKIDMYGTTFTYTFYLDYRSVGVVYAGPISFAYDYKMHNYTYKVTLNSYVTMTLLRWQMKVDGIVVSTHNYTYLGYVFIYTTQNLTSVIHAIYINAWSSTNNVNPTAMTTYVSVIAPKAISPVVQRVVSSDQIEIWGDYEVTFYIQDANGIHYTTGTIIVSIYDSALGLNLYQVILTPNGYGLYDFKVAPWQFGGVYRTYLVKVYMAVPGFVHQQVLMTSFTISSTGENIINIICGGVAYIGSMPAVGSWFIARRKKELGKKVEEDVFNYSSNRFIYPLTFGSAGLVGYSVLYMFLHGMNLLSLSILTSVVLNVVMVILMYTAFPTQWQQHRQFGYGVYVIIGAASATFMGFVAYWSYMVLKLGYTPIVMIMPVVVATIYLTSESFNYATGVWRSFMTQVLYGDGTFLRLANGSIIKFVYTNEMKEWLGHKDEKIVNVGGVNVIAKDIFRHD